MKKRSMHRLHIGSDIWKWYVRHSRLIIFSPRGKRHSIRQSDFFGIKDWEVEDFPAITPAQVRDYITKEEPML